MGSAQRKLKTFDKYDAHKMVTPSVYSKDGGLASINLRFANLTILPDDNCKQIYNETVNPVELYDLRYMICAGSDGISQLIVFLATESTFELPLSSQQSSNLHSRRRRTSRDG